MRVLFFGYHAIGAACLKVLLEPGSNAEVAAVITHEDDSGERIWFDCPGPIAKKAGIETLTPSKEEIRGEGFLNKVKELKPEIILSCYYRHMIPVTVLDIAPLGGFNLHGSYLPEYRGRCPVNWQILNGAARGGVTLHKMVKEADAGDIIAQKAVTIGPRETAHTLFLKLIPMAEELLRRSWPRMAKGETSGISQDCSKATTFGGRGPEDGLIDWNSGALYIDRLVRAVTHPYPGAFTFWKGRKLFIWEAVLRLRRTAEAGVVSGEGKKIFIGCGRGKALNIVSLQLEGEDEMDASGFISRHRDFKGVLQGGAL